jgi:hypothetical protein
MLGVAIAAMLTKPLCSSDSRADENTLLLPFYEDFTPPVLLKCIIHLWCGSKSGCIPPVFLCESSCISLCNTSTKYL